jgi:hypothetical protein
MTNYKGIITVMAEPTFIPKLGYALALSLSEDATPIVQNILAPHCGMLCWLEDVCDGKLASVEMRLAMSGRMLPDSHFPFPMSRKDTLRNVARMATYSL